MTTTCSGLLFTAVSYEARLAGGQAGNILGREMRQGVTSHELGYQVCLNAGHTTVWGNRVQGNVYTGTMLLSLFTRTQNRTVYGRLPASQPVDSGDYADSPVITVIY